MCICIEGPNSLDGNTLEDIVSHYKAVKLTVNFIHNFDLNSVFILWLKCLASPLSKILDRTLIG